MTLHLNEVESPSPKDQTHFALMKGVKGAHLKHGQIFQCRHCALHHHCKFPSLREQVHVFD